MHKRTANVSFTSQDEAGTNAQQKMHKQLIINEVTHHQKNQWNGNIRTA